MIRRLFLTLSVLTLTAPALAQTMPAPGPEHGMMAKLAGTWEGTMTVNIPGMEPMTTPSSNVAELAHGGFWLVGEFQGSLMGVEFTGHSVMGYDPGKGKWLESWVSNLAPEMAMLEGDYDPATRTWSKFREDAKDMFTGAPAIERHQLTLVDDDTYTMTIAQKVEGGEFQVLVEVEHRRK